LAALTVRQIHCAENLKMKKKKEEKKEMVSPRRFERPTHSLEGCCSIQLSYGLLKKEVLKDKAARFRKSD
jgi:hypothetical protein